MDWNLLYQSFYIQPKTNSNDISANINKNLP